jgi:hypothetical protein
MNTVAGASGQLSCQLSFAKTADPSEERNRSPPELLRFAANLSDRAARVSKPALFPD